MTFRQCALIIFIFLISTSVWSTPPNPYESPQADMTESLPPCSRVFKIWELAELLSRPLAEELLSGEAAMNFRKKKPKAGIEDLGYWMAPLTVVDLNKVEEKFARRLIRLMHPYEGNEFTMPKGKFFRTCVASTCALISAGVLPLSMIATGASLKDAFIDTVTLPMVNLEGAFIVISGTFGWLISSPPHKDFIFSNVIFLSNSKDVEKVQSRLTEAGFVSID
jgi:hypothetical protein